MFNMNWRYNWTIAVPIVAPIVTPIVAPIVDQTYTFQCLIPMSDLSKI